MRTGWAAEDSYISFRVVDNFLAGYGLTWNPGERVQVYTDPLFVLLVIAGSWISRNVYWASVIVSLLLTMAAYFFLMDRRPAPVIAVGVTALLSSKAFMDFSVSGLENPATNLGIAVFCWAYWRKPEPLLLTLIAALTAVNRLDSFVLFLPALLLVYYRAGRRAWQAMLLGLTPLIAWELFSLFYYGFLFPNTAYAKLGSGLKSLDLMQQGFRYLLNDYQWDKATAGVIVGGILLGFWAGEWPLALGCLLSVLYVVRAGGDFMSGRFLCAPFVLACAIVLQHVNKRWLAALPLAALILIAGLLDPRPALETTTDYGARATGILADGIADERAFFYRATGMLRWRSGLRWPDFVWTDTGEKFRKEGPSVILIATAGIIPFHAGPHVHFIDMGALGDPLLARLPPANVERPGHYWRAIPPGYLETKKTGVNQILDPNLAEYYKHLHVIVSGDLWDAER